MFIWACKQEWLLGQYILKYSWLTVVENYLTQNFMIVCELLIHSDVFKWGLHEAGNLN